MKHLQMGLKIIVFVGILLESASDLRFFHFAKLYSSDGMTNLCGGPQKNRDSKLFRHIKSKLCII